MGESECIEEGTEYTKKLITGFEYQYCERIDIKEKISKTDQH